jgi:hypothetical protein
VLSQFRQCGESLVSRFIAIKLRIGPVETNPPLSKSPMQEVIDHGLRGEWKITLPHSRINPSSNFLVTLRPYK